MNSLSYNQSLDLILKHILLIHNDSWVKYEILIDEIKPEIYPKDSTVMLESLATMGFLQFFPGMGYKLTPLGKSMAETGNGFVAIEKRDQLLYTNSIKSLELEKKNYCLTIFIAVITFVGLIATIITMFHLI